MATGTTSIEARADPRVSALLEEVGLPSVAAARTRIVGQDPVLPSRFRVGEAAAVALAACGTAAALLWREATGEEQDVSVEVRRAAASLVGFALQRVEDGPTPPLPLGNPLVALYRCGDGRWIHLHGYFPHLAERTLRVLRCSADSDALAAAAAKWEALALEEALAAEGTCGAVVRTAEEWRAHPQGAAVSQLGRVHIEQLSPATPEPVGNARRPLGGVRVLDLTRILAGPTAGRVLAEHGADVLLVTSPKLPNIPAFVMDTGHGKLSSSLGLEQAEDVRRLRQLIAEADVFIQGYRSGALERRGFGPQELARLRPGIICVTLNCYGDVGPWRTRRGWEQMAQSVTGLAAREGDPQLILAAPCDYTTGYLAALGTMAALWRRAQEGGSYHVRVSLCQTGRWLSELRGDWEAEQAPGFGDFADWMLTTQTPFGRLRHLAPVVEMTKTPPRWERPSVPPGTHAAEWPKPA